MSEQLKQSPALIKHTLEDGTVFTEKSRRCVRGIPIGKAVWLPGDGLAGEPKHANDNYRSGRWPLQEEFKAGRLGLYADEGKILWSTAKWIDLHYDLANRPANACSPGLGRTTAAGELGNFVDREDSDNAMGSSDPEGFQTEVDLLARLGGIDPALIRAQPNPADTLATSETRAQSIKICQHLKYRMDCNYRHVVNAVVNRWEMKAIGEQEGARSAAAGRAFVRAGLRTASLVRLDLTRWEARSELGLVHAIGPLPDKPGVYDAAMLRAANDDLRYVRDVA